MQTDLPIQRPRCMSRGVGGQGQIQGQERLISFISLSQAFHSFPELGPREGEKGKERGSERERPQLPLAALTEFLPHGPFQLYPRLKGCCQDERHRAVMN